MTVISVGISVTFPSYQWNYSTKKIHVNFILAISAIAIIIFLNYKFSILKSSFPFFNRVKKIENSGIPVKFTGNKISEEASSEEDLSDSSSSDALIDTEGTPEKMDSPPKGRYSPPGIPSNAMPSPEPAVLETIL